MFKLCMYVYDRKELMTNVRKRNVLRRSTSQEYRQLNIGLNGEEIGEVKVKEPDSTILARKVMELKVKR